MSLSLLGILVVCFALGLALTSNADTLQPGLKVVINQSALTYTAHKFMPVLQKQLQHIPVPDLNQRVDTPIGHIDLSVSAINLSGFSFPSADLLIAAGNNLHATIKSASASAYANWHYRKSHWPHVSDHGNADLSINVDIDVVMGIVLDNSHKSGMKVSMSTFTVHFNSFHLKLHGGASWLYNIFIGALKGNIEHSIEKSLAEQMPAQIVGGIQKSLDHANLDVPFPHGVAMTCHPREIKFDTTNKMIILGPAGEFYALNIPRYPNPARVMPDTVNNAMIQILISDYLMNTAGHAFDKVGAIKTVVKKTDIPASWPIQLNTGSFEYIVPELYKKYPDQDMQLTFEGNSTNPPFTKITQKDGIQLFADADTQFQVLDAQGNPTTAFTIDLKLSLSIQGNVKEGKVISGDVTFQSMNMTLSQSDIGPVDVSTLDYFMEMLTKNIIVPLLNVFTEKGFEIPQLNQITLVKPQLKTMDGFVEIWSDFTWDPQALQEETPKMCPCPKIWAPKTQMKIM